MLSLEYTTKGYVRCGCDELAAGKVVDLPINIENIPTLPESIRGIVQLVTPVEVEGVEGRIYSIDYEEAQLLGLITHLEPEEVDLPICVSDYTLAKEYVDTTYGGLPSDVEEALAEGASDVEEAIATIPFESSGAVAASEILTFTGDTSASGQTVTVDDISMLVVDINGLSNDNIINTRNLGRDLTDEEMAVAVAEVINGVNSTIADVTYENLTGFTNVTASSNANTATVKAVATGEAGNLIALSETLVNGEWGSTTLKGGVDGIYVPKILYKGFDPEFITPSSNGNVFIDVEAMLPLLTLPAAPPEGRSFRLEATVTITSDEALNDKDSSAMFVLVGQVGNGGTVSAVYKQEADLDTLTATRVGQGLQVGFDNNGTSDKRMFVQAQLTAFNHI